MKKFLIIIFTLLIIPNAYAEIKNCKYKLDMDENENGDVFFSLLTDDNYSHNNANGKICFISSDGDISFTLKNGKIVGGIEFVFYYYRNQPALEMYLSNYKIFIDILDNIDSLLDNGDDSFILSLVKNNNLNMNATSYYENGNIDMKYIVKNGMGNITIYREDGSMHSYRPIKDYKLNGTAEIYTDNGRLFATIIYQDDKIISGKCANNRKNGAEWTRAEISNWENGVKVDCGYF